MGSLTLLLGAGGLEEECKPALQVCIKVAGLREGGYRTVVKILKF